jgi:ParB-like chromosome segregation protein Spo0J
LADAELSLLEESLVREGCRDALISWKNGARDILLDGHHRLEICQRLDIQFAVTRIEIPSRDAAKIWIIENQFGRRNLAPFTRGELALKLEPLYAALAKVREYAGKRVDPAENSPQGSVGETRVQIAKVAGISENTMAKVKLICAEADKDTKRRLRNNEISIHRVATDLKNQKQQAERQAARVEAAANSDLHQNIIVGDFRDEDERIADGSLSLIFTDPPYDRQSESLLPGLADFAARKLAPGGSIVFYVGHLQLPAAFRSFEGKLRHWWTCACVHAGSQSLMREYGIRVGWKPMLWFVKETRDRKQDIISDTVTGQTEKSHHEWQQALSEARHWIEALCPDDGIVCDPFLGGGTTAVAAIQSKRRWIGFEKDLATSIQASSRIHDQTL